MSELQYTTLDDAYELKKAHPNDAGYDLTAAQYTVVEPGLHVLIETPFCVSIPEGYVGLVKDRSSMAVGYFYTHAGVIDSGYTGRVKVLLENSKPLTFWQKFLKWLGRNVRYHDWQLMKINPGDRIAQLIVLPVFQGQAIKARSLHHTERGDNGFGSTGK